jgi:hypothetical protein
MTVESDKDLASLRSTGHVVMLAIEAMKCHLAGSPMRPGGPYSLVSSP